MLFVRDICCASCVMPGAGGADVPRQERQRQQEQQLWLRLHDTCSLQGPSQGLPQQQAQQQQ